MNAITKEAIDKRQEEGFASFMGTESTKVLISTIPEGTTQDALNALLRGAYDAGYRNGIATMMVGILESMMKDRKA